MSREKEDRMPHSELHCRALLLAAACAIFATPFAAQNTPPPASTPAFDVATIKLHEGIVSITGLINRPDGINASAASLTEMIAFAYGLRSDDQVSGGPAWVKSDRYDMEAKMGVEDAAAFQKLSPDAMKERRRQMLRALLEDRLHLQTHLVTRDVPVYELIVVKGGPKMKDAATDTNDQLRKGPDGKPLAGFMQFFQNGSSIAQGYSMTALANLLSQSFSGVGRPVVDKTELTSTYNFTLGWSPQMKSVLGGGPATVSTSSEDAPSIFTAIRELGLTLQPATGSEQIVVIDHVERPSAN